MILADFIAHANDISDESESNETITGFLNDGIAKINAECKAAFPFMSYTDLEATIPLPETWVRTVLLPFAAGRIKTKDSSQFEYSDLYAEFQNGLSLFRTNYKIPDIYKDPSSSSYTSDIYTTRPFGWMGW